MKLKIIIGAVIVMALLAGATVLKDWYTNLPSLLTTQYFPTPEIQTATKIKKTEISTTGIVVLDKKEVAKKLKLPEDIAADDNKQITQTAEIPPYEGKTEAIAIFDVKNHTIQIDAKQVPLPLFGLENKKAIGLRYGYSVRVKSDIQNGMEADLYGRWDFLRIGAVHVGLYGEVTSTGDGKAMLNLEYRF